VTSRLTIKSAYVFVGILAISCAVNLAVLFTLGPVSQASQLDSDEVEYYNLSGDLLHRTYEFSPRRVLGHAVVLAAFRWTVGDNMTALQSLVAILFSFSAPMAYLVARRFCPTQWIAAVIGLAVAFWPPLVAYGITLYSETTALPFFLAFLAALPSGRRLTSNPAPAWRWIVSGVMLGVCMLIRPMYLLFTPFVPLIIWAEENNLRSAAWRTVLLAIGCAAVVSPWSLYASIKVGKPLLLSTNGGETLAGGLNPNLIRNGYMVQVMPDGRKTWTGPGKWIVDINTGFLHKEELTLSQDTKDRLLKERTMRWIISNPRAVMYLETAKLAYMWGIYPFWNGAKQTLLGNIPTILLLTACAWALTRLRTQWHSLAMLWCMPLFVSLVALVSWGSWRFRQPADVALLTIAVLLASSLFLPINHCVRAKISL
jgi:hypothetical protein